MSGDGALMSWMTATIIESSGEHWTQNEAAVEEYCALPPAEQLAALWSGTRWGAGLAADIRQELIRCASSALMGT